MFKFTKYISILNVNKISSRSYCQSKSKDLPVVKDVAKESIKTFESKTSETDGDLKRKPSVPRFEVSRAAHGEYDTIMQLVRQSFFMDEPIVKAIGLSEHSNPILEDKIYEMITEGMTLVAKPVSGESILGVAINTKKCDWDADHIDRLAMNVSCPKTKKLLHFLAHVDRSPQLCKKYKVSNVFQLAVLTTSPDVRKVGVATRLISSSLAYGGDIGFKLVSVVATNHYAIKICESLGMKPEFDLAFNSYLGENSEPVFKVAPPHTHVKVFIHQTDEKQHI